MADTERTRTAVLALMADNVIGQISAQDVRDFIVSIMVAEFENPGDVFKEPMPSELSTDKTARGWIDYSQVMLSACSYGDALFLHTDGTWGIALGSEASRMPCAGLALGSYTAAATTAEVLRRGIICMTALSDRMVGMVGQPVYLQSKESGHFSITGPAGAGYSTIIGFVEPNGINSSNTYKMRFDPSWAVTGA